MDNNKVFADGAMFKEPSPNAPEWIKGKMSFKVDEFIAFLTKHQTNAGWVNLDLKKGKTGKYYMELNTFVPERPAGMKAPVAASDVNEEDSPF